ncbi:MAG TPA: type II/IV secretion system protein [Vicinamibacterales bacterium]|nr:type II/IV secretion system protein [Vicinamibacterales bacterium]
MGTRFGEALLAKDLLNPHDLAIAVDHCQRQHVPLVEAVVDLGFVSENDSYAALAVFTGLPLVDLSEMKPSTLALRLVPERVARRHQLLPLNEDNRLLTYAISRPYNDEAERDVAFASGRHAQAVVARRSDLVNALDKYYQNLGDVDLILDRVRSTTAVKAIGCDDAGVLTSSPIIDLCNHIVARAVEAGASDVHIEPTKQGLIVRYRLGGILEPAMTLPPDAATAIRNRYKVMARVDISVKHRPQDGSFRLLVNGRNVDIRLSTLPTINGEKFVMRVIDSRLESQGLEALGYDADNLDRLKKSLERPDGLVLVTGPTGSGKTTVLYSALHHLRTGRSNIVSVEDPVERQVEGVNQIPVNNKGGNGFAAVLRSVLRQDPNVIMVGEIRDNEVAQIVGQAAYTGHLVLSSLHTSDAASAITRLLNLGLEPFRIAESLTAVVAQRLVRKLCPDCRTKHDEIRARNLGREHGIASVPASVGPGCDRCRHTGYIDRVPVAEVLTPTDEVRDAIGKGATASEIRAAMLAAGCKSMRQRGLELVAEGVTTIDEINRVLAAEQVAAKKGSDGKRVLIVDDDRITRMLVKLLLEKEGYEVLEGENGRQAVDIAHRERPDLLVIDLMMPDMDGFQAIEHIRHDVSLSTLPVLVVTAEDGPGIEERVLELGADDYIVKPFEAPILISRVKAAFRRIHRIAAA